jgi:hypothetical protein
MKRDSFFLLCIILATGIWTTSGALPGEHTADEWRSILAVTEDDRWLTGLQIGIAITPNQYYLTEGTLVNITGMVTNVFGPISQREIMLARGVNEAPSLYQNLTTDENGTFLFSDIINATGTVRYQAWAAGSDIKGKNQTRSNEIEVRAEKNLTAPFQDQGDQIPEDEGLLNLSQTYEPASGEQADAGENGTATLDLPSESPERLLSLQAEPVVFDPGRNISMSGVLISESGSTRPHTPVQLETRTGNETFSRIGDLLVTDRNGTYGAAYHLTGPYDPDIRAVASPGSGQELLSDVIPLTFDDGYLIAPARERRDIRSIDAYLSPPIVLVGENCTISGWFADGNGDAIAYGSLHVYWYNFADRIWDRYKDGSEIITNKDGYYTANISSPSEAGVSYLAVVSRSEKTGKPLFSPVQVLIVREPETEQDPVMETSLTGRADPPEVRIGEQAEITFTLSDQEGTPLAGEPVTILFSDDGFTWFMNEGGNLTTRSDGTITMSDIPHQSGFHYYRSVYDGSENYRAADSGIITLIITDQNEDSRET